MLTKSCQYAQLLQFNKEIIKCGYEKICCPQLRTSSKSTNKIFSTEIKSTTPTILTTTQTTTTTSVKHSAKLVWGSKLFLFFVFVLKIFHEQINKTIFKNWILFFRVSRIQPSKVRQSWVWWLSDRSRNQTQIRTGLYSQNRNSNFWWYSSWTQGIPSYGKFYSIYFIIKMYFNSSHQLDVM